jgi:Icc-related predicted phosphoesterase
LYALFFLLLNFDSNKEKFTSQEEMIKEKIIYGLSIIDKILNAHDIYYTISYGTLLGAVRHWDMIPLDTDVLITHGPMKGFLDMTVRGVSTGCPYLLEKSAEMTNLKLFVCGHIHEAYGKFEFPDGGVFVNASTLNFNYKVGIYFATARSLAPWASDGIGKAIPLCQMRDR